MIRDARHRGEVTRPDFLWSPPCQVPYNRRADTAALQASVCEQDEKKFPVHTSSLACRAAFSKRLLCASPGLVTQVGATCLLLGREWFVTGDQLVRTVVPCVKYIAEVLVVAALPIGSPGSGSVEGRKP